MCSCFAVVILSYISPDHADAVADVAANHDSLRLIPPTRVMQTILPPYTPPLLSLSTCEVGGCILSHPRHTGLSHLQSYCCYYRHPQGMWSDCPVFIINWYCSESLGQYLIQIDHQLTYRVFYPKYVLVKTQRP